jgi:hypothetical protein
VRVTDNGVPSLSDTKSFSVAVAGVVAPAPVANTPPVLTSVGGQSWTQAGGQQLLVNGSFESFYTGWTGTGNQTVSAGYLSAKPSDGVIMIAFNGGDSTPNGVVSQSFATVSGQTYALSFDMGVLAFNQNEQRLQVTAQGNSTLFSQTYSIFGPGGGATKWTSQNGSFVADSATTTLTFTDVSPGGSAIDMFLDNVRVAQSSNGSPLLYASVGTALGAQVVAVDSSIPANALSYGMVSGPAGASITSSGLFSWTPTSSGTYNVTVQVTDNGTPPLSDTESFQVVASTTSALPRIARKAATPNDAPALTAILPRNGCVLQHDGLAQVQLQVPPGRPIDLEVSEDLKNWTYVGSVISAEDGHVRFTDENAGQSGIRFYRAISR